MSEVLDLVDCASAPVAQIGGKAAGLGRLVAGGFDVPPGFVVSTDCFRAWLDARGLDSELERLLADVDGPPSARAAARAIAELFAAEEFTSRAIDAAYQRLGGEPRRPVAVRSSATAEDAESTSFAGQQDTYLWIRGAADIRRRVVDCWASLFSAEAVLYRMRLGWRPAEGAMAVVVQAMVPAESAGVMFTVDPVSGDRSQIAIESVIGLGMPLVSGEITPDRYCVDKVSLEIRSRSVASKPFADVLDARLGEATRKRLAPPDADAPSLTDAEVVRLAELGRRLERTAGGPMDVEWALGPADEEARRPYLLQARPVTALPQQARVGTSPSRALGSLLRQRPRIERTQQGEPT